MYHPLLLPFLLWFLFYLVYQIIYLTYILLKKQFHTIIIFISFINIYKYYNNFIIFILTYYFFISRALAESLGWSCPPPITILLVLNCFQLQLSFSGYFGIYPPSIFVFGFLTKLFCLRTPFLQISFSPALVHNLSFFYIFFFLLLYYNNILHLDLELHAVSIILLSIFISMLCFICI